MKRENKMDISKNANGGKEKENPRGNPKGQKVR
jgi:hypothetical protein